jgi:hypothetical protein
MNTLMTTEQVESFLAEQVQFYCVKHLSKSAFTIGDNAQLRVMLSHAAEDLVLTMYSWCAAGQVPSEPSTRTIRWPDGPWQAIRERFAPAWWLKRYPMRWREETVTTETRTYFVCPHVRVPSNNPLHIQFMATGTPQAMRIDREPRD